MVEIETSLKHSLENLKERIAGTNSRVIIIVPNSVFIDKYRLLGERALVMTIDSVKEMLTEPEHPNHGKYFSYNTLVDANNKSWGSTCNR